MDQVSVEKKTDTMGVCCIFSFLRKKKNTNRYNEHPTTVGCIYS